MWHLMFSENQAPSLEQMSDYVGSGRRRWNHLNEYLQSTYHVQPIIEYSSCSAQPGWNVKYKKSGKALCTLYPLKDSFIVLVVVGPKHDAQVAFEMDARMYTASVTNVFSKAKPMAIGRWLMIEVVDDKVLEDIKHLIGIRLTT
ncbi:hypothetical protein DSECCO2_548980 [anaerobic digester metagenome]